MRLHAVSAKCLRPSHAAHLPKQAVELSQLRQQLFEQQRAAREGEAQLTAAARDNEELQARVALLQATVTQLERWEAGDGDRGRVGCAWQLLCR